MTLQRPIRSKGSERTKAMVFGKKAFARTKPTAAKARPAAKKVNAKGQRAETAEAGGASVPSSPTRTAAAPKSSSESLRSTGITEPAGSR